LQKEREEREIDDKFMGQKDEIIAKAKQLDEEAKQFTEKQKKMTQDVQTDIAGMVINQLRRKKEDTKLMNN
jgi:hypothetical protein